MSRSMAAGFLNRDSREGTTNLVEASHEASMPERKMTAYCKAALALLPRRLTEQAVAACK